MKEIIILITVLLLVFVPNYLFKVYLDTSGRELIEIALYMKNQIENEQVLNKDIARQLKDVFEEKERLWILIVDHDMLDEIEYEVEECIAMFDYDTKNEFRAACSRLKDEIEDLSKREQISLANII